MYKYVLPAIASALLALVLTTTVLADKYAIPVTVNGKTVTVTIDVSRGHIDSVASENAKVGEPVAVRSEAMTETEMTEADWLYIHDFPEFGAGEAGELSVVYSETHEFFGTGFLYIVIRNNTDETLDNIEIEVDFYDKNYDFIETKSDIGRTPTVVPPGGLTVAQFYIDGDNFDEIDSYDVFVKGDIDNPFSFNGLNRTPKLSDVKQTRRRVVGKLINTSNKEMNSVSVKAICYDEEENQFSEVGGEVNSQTLKPGESAAFSLQVGCEKYIITSGARD